MRVFRVHVPHNRVSNVHVCDVYLKSVHPTRVTHGHITLLIVVYIILKFYELFIYLFIFYMSIGM
jgi:hypothetical protein